MARQKKEDPPKGSAPWMNTFADLMNLLLCFFVLLFSMSTVDAEKFEMVIASLQSSFSILPSGGASIGDGQMISAGVSQLELLDEYYKKQANSTDTEESEEDIKEAYEQEALDESEKMAEQVEQQAQEEGIQNQVEVDFNAQYVLITLNGALLFAVSYTHLDVYKRQRSGYGAEVAGNRNDRYQCSNSRSRRK